MSPASAGLIAFLKALGARRKPMRCAAVDRPGAVQPATTVAQSRQGGPYLSAVDTAAVAQAYREIRLVCTESLRATNGIERKVRAASAVARRYPDKIFRSGASDHARPVVDTMGDMAGQLRACGHAKLATKLFSRRRERS